MNLFNQHRVAPQKTRASSYVGFLPLKRNEAWAKKIKGEKKLPERCDVGGPNPARTKAEILAYLRDSIRMVDDAIASTNADNLQQPLPGRTSGTHAWHA